MSDWRVALVHSTPVTGATELAVWAALYAGVALTVAHYFAERLR